VSRDKKSNGGPVCITGLDGFLVLSHGVYLNIGGVVVDIGCSFPSDNILDVVAFESSKNDNVATKEG